MSYSNPLINKRITPSPKNNAGYAAKAVDAVAHTLLRTSLRVCFKLPSGLPLPASVLRQGMEFGSQLFRVHPEAAVKALTLGGISTEKISSAADTRSAILHLHGGAFFAGSSRTHRAMASEIAVRSGCTVYMVNYRLAPEHPYPAALEDGLASYKALLAEGYAAENIMLGGDSGGCTHILALAVALRDQGLPLPCGLFMISPFLDLSLSNPSVARNKGRDPMVTAYSLRRGADGYRARLHAKDKRVSPLFADLTGLPPVLVQAGQDEILADDATQFSALAKRAGMQVDCRLYEGMWHNFQMFNAFSLTADRALDEIAEFVRYRVKH